MNQDSLVIGHYGKDAHTGFNETLKELNVSNFNRVIAETEVCPYKPTDRDYKVWKQLNLHNLYFTRMENRPPKDGSRYNPTGFASIDIDHRNEKFTLTHPSVWGVNKTPNGTHIIVYGTFGRTPADWQHSYLCIAHEVLSELKSKYGSDIRLDGSCAKYTQGCFLWNSEWDFSSPFDIEYRPTNRAFDDDDIDLMFEKKDVGGKLVQSFSWEEQNTAYYAGGKTAKDKLAKSTLNQNDTDSLNLASGIGIDKDMRGDLFALDRVEWLRKYEAEYRPILESPAPYSYIQNYKGDWVDMAFLDGKHTRLWLPIPRWSKDGNVGGKVKKGGRIKAMDYHVKCLARLMDEFMGGADPNQMLFNAVWFVANECEAGLAKSDNGEYSVTNSEILSHVVSAYNTHKYNEDDILYRDKKLFKCGKKYIDGETGEEVHLNDGDPSSRTKKIALNSIQRKTLRIVESLRMFDPTKTVEDNLESINGYSRLEKITARTLKEYIRLAKGMDSAVARYPWLKGYELGDKRRTTISIKDKRNGKVMTFKSVKECLKALNWCKPTYYKFIKGNSKFNKIYTLISDNQLNKP